MAVQVLCNAKNVDKIFNQRRLADLTQHLGAGPPEGREFCAEMVGKWQPVGESNPSFQVENLAS